MEYTKTDPPRWFVAKIQDGAVDFGELLTLVKRRARYLAAEDERSALFRVQIGAGAGAVEMSGASAQLLVELLWAALGLLEAAGVAHAAEPAASA